VPDLKIEVSPRFRQEAQALLGPEHGENFLKSLEWMLLRGAEMGQRVRGSRKRVWPYFPGDGYVYLAYYEIVDNEVRLTSLVKRPTPISPQILDLED